MLIIAYLQLAEYKNVNWSNLEVKSEPIILFPEFMIFTHI